MESISIKFLNWEKHQPRKDYKHPWWFALNNDFPIDQKLCNFYNEQKLCLIFLLCEASKQAKNGELTINVDYWCKIVSINRKILMQTIEMIESVQIAYRICTGSVHTEQNRTEQNNNIYVLPDGNATPHDFELIFSAYPKRKGSTGKAEALKKIKQLVNGDGDFNKLLSAATNYATECRKNGNYGTEFVAMASTFFGKKEIYKEWVDYSTNNVYSASDEELLKAGRGY